MKSITYRKFKKFLEKENNYTDEQCRHLFNAVKRMDMESRRWVLDWIDGLGYPTKVVEQITVEELVKDFSFNPLNAFIVIDWLKQEPDVAKYYIIASTFANPDNRGICAMEEEMLPIIRGKELVPGIGLNTELTEDVIQVP